MTSEPTSPVRTFSVAYGNHNEECDTRDLVEQRRQALGSQKERRRIFHQCMVAKKKWKSAQTILDRLIAQREFYALVAQWENIQFRPFRQVGTTRRRLFS